MELQTDSQKRVSLVKMTGITKIYPGVIACNKVDMEVYRGEVHALVGENGAGKSTLIKILAGSEKANSGQIYFDGNTYTSYLPSKAIQLGISVIYQEFNLLNQLQVYENVFFGKELRHGIFIDIKSMIKRVIEISKELGMTIDPKQIISNLSIAEQQIVEIIKALINEAKLIVMDEPSATLTSSELKMLFSLIRSLKQKGTSIIYISHRLEEIFEIADRVTIMRDGHYIATKVVTDTNRSELIKLMVGRELIDNYPLFKAHKEEIVLEVRNLSSEKVGNVSFNLKRGELLGITGLVGAGRTELFRAIFGADKSKGEIFVNGRKVIIKNPRDAIKAGIVLLPEDRKAQGLFLEQSLVFNITFGILNKLTFGKLVIRNNNEKELVQKFIDILRIKTSSMFQKTKFLSGGNQQKAVLAKWLATNSEIIIFDEPTRGIDVGAKQEIYSLMVDLKRQGKSIIMITSELPELIGMSDRAIIMRKGRIVGELPANQLEQEKILSISVGEETT
jgi:ribose transport system ATP-binding protein